MKTLSVKREVSSVHLVPTLARPQVRGKFLFVGNQKFYVKGVTYGTFKRDADSVDYPQPAVVRADFAAMLANGVNCIRTYTVPPMWLLDLAGEQGLRVMVGLPWTQHVTFLDDSELQKSIQQTVRAGVRACAGHPAILCFAVGNEIPASIVRWHGRTAVQRFIKRLYQAAKEEDPEALVTYVNFPTTAYLQLPFLDFVCFNVYLETQEKLRSYLAQLQNSAADRPLVLGEVGLDSQRNGVAGQAANLEWQISTIFSSGCAGLFVFSWTDEWHRGGSDIDDWDFGLTTRDRHPKPALAAVRKSWRDVPFSQNIDWPRVSVVVCSYNGSKTIRDCFEHLRRLDYPDFEIIVVNDGSTDATPMIAAEYGVRLINIPNGGLSNARNVGLRAATGEIIAYIDDDAYPDQHWLKYLAHTFMMTTHAGVGGPNIPPSEDGPVAECVANAPGGPIHVMITDTEAEHIPGCNMAFNASALRSIDEFDPQFRSAGDDVDVCWRLLERGWTLGFHPSAVVWHHRRNSVVTYWKQQVGYGRAEGMLEQKWPEKYNALGHVSWEGRLYGRGVMRLLPLGRGRIYQGIWGSAPFQSIYGPPSDAFGQVFQTPEWYMVCAGFLLLSIMGLFWPPLAGFGIPFILSILPLVAQAISGASNASFWREKGKWKLYLLTAILHFVQPLARLRGRLQYGLTPWRRRGVPELKFPRSRLLRIWSESWQSSGSWLATLQSFLTKSGAVVLVGTEFEAWDLEVRGGLMGGVRTQLAIEEHGHGKQFLKFRVWPTVGVRILTTLGVMILGGAYAAVNNHFATAIIVGSFAVALVIWMLNDCAFAKASLSKGMEAMKNHAGRRD